MPDGNEGRKSQKSPEPNKGASKKKLERPFSHKPDSFHMKIVRKLKSKSRNLQSAMPSRIYSKLMSHESATRKPEDLYFSPTQSTILKQKTLRVVKQKRSFKYGSPTFEERLVDKDIIPRLATAKTRKVSRGKQSITFQRRNPQKNMVNI